MRWLRRKDDFEPDVDNSVFPRDGIWPEFLDDPGLTAFFEGTESLAMPSELPPPPPRLMLAPLRPLDWNVWYEDDVFVRGRTWSDPNARLVFWSDLWIGETRRLGPTLCFDVASYGQV